MRCVQEHDDGGTPPDSPEHLEQKRRAGANNEDDDDSEPACEEQRANASAHKPLRPSSGRAMAERRIRTAP